MGNEIKILFIGVSPDDRQPLELTREAETIRRRLTQAAHRDRFELVQRWKTAAEELPKLVMEHAPQLVHLSGHGTRDGLYFRGPEGSAQLASPEHIARLFHVLPGVRCVVLNTCHSSEQARLIARHVDAVVGVGGEIPDDGAIAFSAGFYGALGHGRDLQTAFELGQLQVGLSSSSREEGFALYVREGVDASALRLHEAGARAVLDREWLAALRRGLVDTLAPPALSGLPRAELRAGVTIDELFVGPWLRCCGESPHAALDSLPRYGDEDRRGLLIRFEDFERAWFGKLERCRRADDAAPLKVVVQGSAGSGKSMICRVLATRAAKGGGPLPLLLRARDWAGGARRGILEHIALETTSVLSTQVAAGQLELLCETGSAQLFVDGFDELARAEHESLCARLHGFASAFPRVPILVTSRLAHGVASKLGLEGFVELQLAEFRGEQLRVFAERWGERLVNSSGESLWRALEAEPHAMDLAKVPLFAALLAFLHARGGQLPTRRSRLYQQCVDEMLVVWPEHGARLLPERSGDHMRPILEDLALSIQSKRDDHFAAVLGACNVSLTPESLDERLLEGLARSRPELGEGDRQALRRRWHRWLLEDSGLLYESKPDHYEFTHLTMVEYLAARAAQRGHGTEVLDPLVEFVRARYDYPIWRHTLLFLLDDRHDSELPRAVFQALLDEEHHGDTLSFLLVMLREGHRISEASCVRLFEACLNPEGTRFVAVWRFYGEILAGEVHREVLSRWLAEGLATQAGARLASLLECMPEGFPVDEYLERRSIESLGPLAMLDREADGLGIGGQLHRGLALIPHRFRLRWAFDRSAHEVFARTRRALVRLSSPWSERWIPALLSRAAWLSSLAIEAVQTSRWSVGTTGYRAPAQLAFSCRCEVPEQRLSAGDDLPAAIKGDSFTVLPGHAYLQGLRALPPHASPAHVAAAIMEALPPESFPSSDFEDLHGQLERFPVDALVCSDAGPLGREATLDDGLVGFSRVLAVIAEVHTASLSADPELADQLVVVRLLHLALLWDCETSFGRLGLRRWARASAEQQALHLALVLAQYQTTWTWPRHREWRELILSEPPEDGLVAHLWHLCRHVAQLGDGDELVLARAALERGVDPELAASLRAYRVEVASAPASVASSPSPQEPVA